MLRILMLAFASLVFAGPASATDDVKRFVADAVGQVQWLAQTCGRHPISDKRLRRLLSDAGMRVADIDDGGRFHGAYVAGRALANEIGADMSLQGVCYHLKARFGPDGAVVPGLVKLSR